MRNNIEKRYFLSKKLIMLKSPVLVQRAFRTKFNIPYCPTRRTISCLSKKFEKTGTLHDLPPKPKNQRELHLEAKNQLKILVCRSEKHLWPLAFHIVFVVILFLKNCYRNRTNIRVLTSFCHLIMKNGSILPNGGWACTMTVTNGCSLRMRHIFP